MFFLGLTLSLLLMSGGVVLFMKGMTLYAVVLVSMGFISLVALIIHYQKRAKRNQQGQGETTINDCGWVPDFGLIPDCDLFGCVDVPDCHMPDCDIPDCDCSPDCNI